MLRNYTWRATLVDQQPWARFQRSEPGWWRVSGAFQPVFVGTAMIGSRVKVIAVVAAGGKYDLNGLRDVPLVRIEKTLRSWDRGRDWAEAEADAGSPSLLVKRLKAAAQTSAVEPAPGRTGAVIQPPARPVPDAFYADVAQAYRELSGLTPKPILEIAREAGVGLRTAQGWVAEARKRGHLPPGQRGRVM